MGHEDRGAWDWEDVPSNKQTVQFYLGTADGHWYYCRVGRTIDAIGPFLTKTCAEQHAKDGTFRVID